MKKVLYILLFLFSFTKVFGQQNAYIRGDSVFLTNKTKSAIIVLQNATKDTTGGFAKNVGHGVIHFVKINISDVKGLSDSLGKKIYFSDNFKYVDTVIDLADTLKSVNLVIKSGSSIFPQLTLISNLAQPALTVKNTETSDGRAGINYISSKNNQSFEMGVNVAGQNKAFALRRTNGVALPAVDLIWAVEPFTDTMTFYHQLRMTGLPAYTAGDSVLYSNNGYIRKGPAPSGSLSNALTLTSSGGASPGATFNGSAAITADYHTFGALRATATVAGHSFSGGTAVTLSTLIATDPSLTFSGSYNGFVNQTVGINWGFSNPWTIAQQFTGGISYVARNASTTDNITNADYYLNYTGTFTATLPQSSLVIGTQTFIVISNTGTITLAAFSGETINGGANITVSAGNTATVYYAGSLNWVVSQVSSVSGGGVTSFNTRSGAVTLTSSDVTTALTFTPYNATNPSNYIALTALSATSPIFYNNSTGVISSQAATTSLNGYLTSTDWNTFNGKQGALTLTTTGTSGAATLIGTTLNIPQYAGTLTASNFVVNETLGGTVNSSNTAFTIAFTPQTSDIQIFRNGQLQVVGTDYTRVTTAVTWLYAPTTGDILKATYIK